MYHTLTVIFIAFLCGIVVALLFVKPEIDKRNNRIDQLLEERTVNYNVLDGRDFMISDGIKDDYLLRTSVNVDSTKKINIALKADTIPELINLLNEELYGEDRAGDQNEATQEDTDSQETKPAGETGDDL